MKTFPKKFILIQSNCLSPKLKFREVMLTLLLGLSYIIKTRVERSMNFCIYLWIKKLLIMLAVYSSGISELTWMQ